MKCLKLKKNETKNENEHGRTCKWMKMNKMIWKWREEHMKKWCEELAHHCMWMLDFENKMSIQIEWNKPFVYFCAITPNRANIIMNEWMKYYS